MKKGGKVRGTVGVLPEAERKGVGLDRSCATYVEPEDDVAVGRVARAAGVLFVTGGVDHDGVVEGACCFGTGYVSLGSCHLLFVTPPHAGGRKLDRMLCEWSGIRVFLSPPLDDLKASTPLSALFLSFSIVTPLIPSPSLSPPRCMSYEANTSLWHRPSKVSHRIRNSSSQ